MADVVVTTELVIAVVAVVVAVAALGIAVPAWRKVRRLDRAVVTADADGAGVVATMVRHEDLLRDLRSDLMAVHDNTLLLRRLAKDAISHVGVVRYDAFDDLSGAMSFSIALLDEQGDGVVVSGIAGRNDSRMYAKPIVGGRCDRDVSDEERTALERAISGGSEFDQAEPGRRRGRQAS